MNITVLRAAAMSFFLILPMYAFAMPSMQRDSQAHASSPAERFHAMDANKNNALTWEELSAARPNLNRNAFDTIDADHDGSITLEEWEKFSAGHGASAKTQKMEGMMDAMRGEGMQKPSAGGAMPLVMPPAQKNGSTGAMPLVVTPPQKNN